MSTRAQGNLPPTATPSDRQRSILGGQPQAKQAATVTVAAGSHSAAGTSAATPPARQQQDPAPAAAPPAIDYSECQVVDVESSHLEPLMLGGGGPKRLAVELASDDEPSGAPPRGPLLLASPSGAPAGGRPNHRRAPAPGGQLGPGASGLTAPKHNATQPKAATSVESKDRAAASVPAKSATTAVETKAAPVPAQPASAPAPAKRSFLGGLFGRGSDSNHQAPATDADAKATAKKKMAIPAPPSPPPKDLYPARRPLRVSKRPRAPMAASQAPPSSPGAATAAQQPRKQPGLRRQESQQRAHASPSGGPSASSSQTETRSRIWDYLLMDELFDVASSPEDAVSDAKSRLLADDGRTAFDAAARDRADTQRFAQRLYDLLTAPEDASEAGAAPAAGAGAAHSAAPPAQADAAPSRPRSPPHSPQHHPHPHQPHHHHQHKAGFSSEEFFSTDSFVSAWGAPSQRPAEQQQQQQQPRQHDGLSVAVGGGRSSSSSQHPAAPPDDKMFDAAHSPSSLETIMCRATAAGPGGVQAAESAGRKY
ncbi:hypothetical protein H696_03455 [Fonticula alba]|uniref:Uncharacterized protein n=1 Tax=Fonticula alba TaxID=691883 RepID=A0A058Z6X7_FONAL|nr:hypothetical protein H696_03455 [Fonticula alba]KCV69990.1 hypothetical protein H696_03455 [Fonticula alba]|eukprot:XP_009495596.1 hypothetical protein H696_03455 [Fonticula alba]